MANNRPSGFAVAGHALLALITGGAWLIVLFIWHVLKK